MRGKDLELREPGNAFLQELETKQGGHLGHGK